MTMDNDDKNYLPSESGKYTDPDIEALELQIADTESLLLEPRMVYDKAIIGTLYGDDTIIYDAEAVIALTQELLECSQEEAREYFEYNIAGSLGENHPQYLWPVLRQEA